MIKNEANMWVNKGAIHTLKINILYHQSISQMHFFSILRFKIHQNSSWWV